ncbi:Diacylglycerol O-acyltransferase 2-like protein 6 [Apodemus speciosus]|uniref:Diacylglycerol O-acyltransferase 2-like protein 6 n=1 Tax=Apodemus speciosus TaxID=105296 RepID=A0ABQ0FUS4_APOSI
MIGTPTVKDGRRSAWVRNWTLWKYFQSYFPVKLVKTHDLSPKHNYIILCHPHGILSYGAFINFATLEGIFWIPFVRDYVMSMGICPVSESALMYKLTQQGSGNAVVIVPGGASESLLCRPGVSTVLLNKRKGFVKLALKTGAYLVPSYSFGENEAYNQETFPEGTWLRGLTRGSWGFLPFNHPITTVVGEPLPVPKIFDPDKDTVAKYFELYISALRKLFDQHKAEYGFSKTQELTII